MWEWLDIQSQRLIQVKNVFRQIEELPGVGISLRKGRKDRAVLMGNWGLSILKTMAARVLPLGERKYNYGKAEKKKEPYGTGVLVGIHGLPYIKTKSKC